MKIEESIHKLIKNLHVNASADLDNRVHDQIAAALAESKTIRSVGRRPILWRLTMKNPFAKLAVAAAIVVALLLGLQYFGDSIENVAFARVIEKVKNAESVSFVLRQKIGNQPVFVSRVYIQGRKMRLDIVGAEGQQEGTEKLQKEMERLNLTALMSMIGDFTQQEVLNLDHFRKTYQKTQMDDRVVAEFTKTNLIKQFHNVKHEDGQWLGEESQDGRKIDVYLVRHVELMGIEAELAGEEGERMKVWVDRGTGLPVRILLEISTDTEGKSRDWFDFSNFTWNQPLDPNLFTLGVPEGYTLVEPTDAAGSLPDQP
jgi:outer membrane lipoprotein-sorting protein